MREKFPQLIIFPNEYDGTFELFVKTGEHQTNTERLPIVGAIKWNVGGEKPFWTVKHPCPLVKKLPTTERGRTNARKSEIVIRIAESDFSSDEFTSKNLSEKVIEGYPNLKVNPHCVGTILSRSKLYSRRRTGRKDEVEREINLWKRKVDPKLYIPVNV